MGKNDKKQEASNKVNPSEELVRNDMGIGCMPQFASFTIPAEGLKAGAIVNGYEISLLKLSADKDASEDTRDEYFSSGNLAGWIPTRPEGEGWFLAAVNEDGETVDPFAIWARKPQPKELSGKAYAQEYLLGSLIKAATKHLKTLAKPWGEMKESEQKRVLQYVHDDCREAIRDAIDIIASNGRLTFPAAVDQVVFKDGVKAVLTLAKTPEAHALADAEGSYVTIVIEERSRLLQEGDALDVKPDQGALFDASVEGTAGATTEEPAVAE